MFHHSLTHSIQSVKNKQKLFCGLGLDADNEVGFDGSFSEIELSKNELECI